jgi:MinD superfamily P-loop ATPase
MRFIQGRLKPAEPSAVRIVREELAQLEGEGIAIVDASPGTACAVQETIAESDFCLLVTEPTPFGLHDLRMAMDVAQEVGVPSGVVINRSGSRDSLIEEECRERSIPVLLKIPLDRRIAEAYSRGEPLVDAFPEWRGQLQDTYAEIERRQKK